MAGRQRITAWRNFPPEAETKENERKMVAEKKSGKCTETYTLKTL